MTSLRVEALSAGYGQVEIIHGVDLQVSEREIIGIIGPNGSGKSTFLKSILGLTRIFSGRIWLGNRDITGIRPENAAEEGIAFIPQTDNVFSDLVCMENLELGAYLMKSKKQVVRKMAEMFELFKDLEPYKRMKAGLMSGGQRQMLAIARALMTQPKILMLDEPTANLSPKITENIAEKIRQIRDSGIPVLIVEQNVDLALKLADRVVVFVSGLKAYEGTPSELKTLGLQRVFLGLKRGYSSQNDSSNNR
ncbi:MAG: ABC transporter ATP-binding protein [Candidatus Caldarchaeum sp.]|nr:ABC transporter ATP-binding protein [Candidatus Caldarchaeum sp.]MCS7138081.1 ABC transporter ATP-binding protein [Candidatus Caldarchaeum sp.]MDW8435802.1 ABC transporter ATP-binding protein [Candidatus Caldarchaeum sp.]